MSSIDSFFRQDNPSSQQQQYRVNGTLKLVNTIEEFKIFDIEQALKHESSLVRLSVISICSLIDFFLFTLALERFYR